MATRKHEAREGREYQICGCARNKRGCKYLNDVRREKTYNRGRWSDYPVREYGDFPSECKCTMCPHREDERTEPEETYDWFSDSDNFNYID